MHPNHHQFAELDAHNFRERCRCSDPVWYKAYQRQIEPDPAEMHGTRRAQRFSIGPSGSSVPAAAAGESMSW